MIDMPNHHPLLPISCNRRNVNGMVTMYANIDIAHPKRGKKAKTTFTKKTASSTNILSGVNVL